MIKLSFTFDGIPRFVRGAFFRICADGTLRGPEGSLVASYTSKGWLLGARSCREFEAHGVPVDAYGVTTIKDAAGNVPREV